MKPDTSDTFGARLRSARKAKHLTQKQLAKAVGIAQPSLSDLESGKSKAPRLETAMALHGYLGVSLQWLMFGEGGGARPKRAHRQGGADAQAR